MYSEGDEPKDIQFKVIKVPTFKFYYRIHKINLISFANRFDVVICMFNFSYLFFRLFEYFPRKFKLIYWGIGVSASYNCRFDSDQNFIIKNLKHIKRADAIIFYSSYPIEKYQHLNINEEKLFVANNTVAVSQYRSSSKDMILFIGSLYKEKKVDVLLHNYYEAYNENVNIPNMYIIGDGDQRNSIEKWINDNKLQDKIILTGSIFDDNQLVSYFERALMCISPDQAGLSVLKSMGYGVPFITHLNAITGGEIFNIKNGYNGILINNFSEIKNIILESILNPSKYIEMGINAKNYYESYRTIDNMANGFFKAIDYVTEDNMSRFNSKE